MTIEPGTPATDNRERGARWGRALARILGIVVAGLIVCLGMLVAFPPAGLLKDRIAQIAGEATGRTVTIGDAHLAFRPDLVLSLDNVTLSNPPGMAGPDLFRADVVKARVRLLPLFKRKIDLLSLDFTKPELNLQEEASARTNWVIEPKTGAKGGVVLPATATLEKGRVSFTSAKTGASQEFDDVNAVVTSDLVSGASVGKGRLGLKGETVAFDIALADIRAVAAGLPSGLKAALDTPHGKAEITGEASFSGRSAITGDLIASSPSVIDLAHWLGAQVTASGAPLKASIAGKVRATASEVTFTGADIVLNGASSRLDGRLGLEGARPKLEGTIASERLDLARLAGTSQRPRLGAQALEAAGPGEEVTVAPGWESLLIELKALEEPDARHGAPQPEAMLEAAPKSAWSEQPFNLNALRAIDLDVVLTANEVAYGGLDLKKGRVKAGLTDGLLDAKLEALDVGKGKAAGTVTLDSRANPPRAAISLNLTDVAAEPIITELTGRPLLSGTSNVEITAAAAGQNPSQMTSTLEGKAKFRMGKGALRGFDIRRMISEWWRSWSFDLARKTGFERLEAQYDIRKGVMKSSPGLALGGSEVEINSRGDVNVPAKRLNQEIRIKVVPPPTALPIPVKISGDWSKPSIGLDWGGLFSSSGDVGGPQGVAPSAQPAPPEVQAAIRRALSASLGSAQLTEEGKAMLRTLLPPGSPEASPADSGGAPQ
jgi:AsmA protein